MRLRSAPTSITDMLQPVEMSTGVTHDGIPFGRDALYYLLSNHFYIGEVKYKDEILPGEQPPIMDRALFGRFGGNRSPNGRTAPLCATGPTSC